MVTVQWPCGPTRRDIRARLRHGNVAMVEIHVVDGKRKYDMLEWNVTGQAVIGAVSVPWSSAACIQGSAKHASGGCQSCARESSAGTPFLYMHAGEAVVANAFEWLQPACVCRAVVAASCCLGELLIQRSLTNPKPMAVFHKSRC